MPSRSRSHRTPRADHSVGADRRDEPAESPTRRTRRQRTHRRNHHQRRLIVFRHVAGISLDGITCPSHDIPERASTVDEMKPTNKYQVSKARQKELFDQRAGETPEQMIARQLAMATPFEVAWLMMVRQTDESDGGRQARAMELLQLARSVWWNRAAVVTSAVGIVVSIAALVVALTS